MWKRGNLDLLDDFDMRALEQHREEVRHLEQSSLISGGAGATIIAGSFALDSETSALLVYVAGAFLIVIAAALERRIRLAHQCMEKVYRNLTDRNRLSVS